MNKKLTIWIFAIIVLANITLGLGISPAEKQIRYTNESQEIIYRIINNEHRELQLQLYAIGQLAEYIKLEQKNITLSNTEEYREVKVIITLPNGLAPGENTAKIVAEETPDEQPESGVRVRMRVISKLKVDVPYPEKYIDALLDLREENKILYINSIVKNLGRRDISNIKATYYIYNNEDLIDTIKSESKKLARGETKELTSVLNISNYKDGSYTLFAAIEFDGESVELGRDFNIGKAIVEILDYTKYFIKGKINKFDINVYNKWNKKIRNAYALVSITGFEVLRSITYDIDPLEEKTITSYWDTSDIGLGKYSSNVSLFYQNETTTKKGFIYVIDEQEFRKLFREPNYLLYIILGFALIILINITWFIVMKRGMDNAE